MTGGQRAEQTFVCAPPGEPSAESGGDALPAPGGAARCRTVIAIDPGTTHSAVLLYQHGLGFPIGHRMYEANPRVLEWLRADAYHAAQTSVLVLEMISSYGMPVGKEVFETVYWLGRFAEAARPMQVERVYRHQVKTHLCGNQRAKDSNIRQALIDKLGATGTTKDRGPTFGITGDLWAALAVAVTYAEREGAR